MRYSHQTNKTDSQELPVFTNTNLVTKWQYPNFIKQQDK